MRLNRLLQILGIGLEELYLILKENGIEIEKHPNIMLSQKAVGVLATLYPQKLVLPPLSLSKTETEKKINKCSSLLSKEQLSKKKPTEGWKVQSFYTLLTYRPVLVLQNKLEKSHKESGRSKLAESEKEEKKGIEKTEIEKTEIEKKIHLHVLRKINLPATEVRKYKKVASSDTSTSFLKSGFVEKREKSVENGSYKSQQKTTFNKKQGTNFNDKKREEWKKRILESKKRKREKIVQKKRNKEKKNKEKKNKVIEIMPFLSTKQLATMLNVTVDKIIKLCTEIKVVISVHQLLNRDLISFIAAELEKEVTFIALEKEEIKESFSQAKISRVAVVVVLGEVDHGKTKMLGSITKISMDKEKGGITQKIAVYNTNINDRPVIFLDTPGHQAFTSMRMHGVKVADIVLLVVAADDGVMPQTEEAISHAQLSGLPIVVGINKIDLPTANVERVKKQLSECGMSLEDWGGDTPCQPFSAQTKEGLPALLDKILIKTEQLDLKADPNGDAVGCIIESFEKKGEGYASNMIVQKGILKRGDIIWSGNYYGKIRAMYSIDRNNIAKAFPSNIVQVIGLNGHPPSGSSFRVMSNIQEARSWAIHYRNKLKIQDLREKEIALRQRFIPQVIGKKESNYVVNFIIKADRDGSLHALSDSLYDMSIDKGSAKIIYQGIGSISEQDIKLAKCSNSVIIGFNIKVDPKVRKILKDHGIKFDFFDVIYDAITYAENCIKEILDPIRKVTVKGLLEVKKIFDIHKVGKVLGCLVLKGSVKRKDKLHIIHEGNKIYESYVEQLKIEKEVVKEARKGQECGLLIKYSKEVKVGDMVESFEENWLQFR